jgi:4-hydroxybutyrate CoA-transferase
MVRRSSSASAPFLMRYAQSFTATADWGCTPRCGLTARWRSSSSERSITLRRWCIVYDYAHDNTAVMLREAGFVNDPHIIRKNPKVTAINSAVEVDLTGQVCADSIGSAVISGVGGQMDFIRGASLSEGGLPIIALTSRAPKGHSRIVRTLREGAGVVTTRAHVHYVVTEYGVADLYGKTLSERRKALIAVAHPEDRELLEQSGSPQ